MRKTMKGFAFMTAATLLLSVPLTLQKEEIKQKVSPQQEDNSASTTLKGAAFVIHVGHVPVTLVDTVDGDTIKVRLNRKIETVRYLLVDTPESTNPEKCIQPFAKEAFHRNNELVSSGTLTLEFENKNKRDSYGRLLAYVYIDGKSVQGTLLKEGFARVGYILNPPYKYLDLFREKERLAKRNKLNIWERGTYVTRWGFNGCLP